jgi:hypothetical protein
LVLIPTSPTTQAVQKVISACEEGAKRT